MTICAAGVLSEPLRIKVFSPSSTSPGPKPALPKKMLAHMTAIRTTVVPMSTTVSRRLVPDSAPGCTLDITGYQFQARDDAGRRTEDVVTDHVVDLTEFDCFYYGK